jgi:signal transduction histidine kinase
MATKEEKNSAQSDPFKYKATTDAGRLSELEHRYKTLVNVLFPDFIFVFDRNFDFVDIITPDGLNLFHNKEELIGTTARQIYSSEVSDLFLSNIADCLDNHRIKEIEYHLDLFGTTYYYQARLIPIEDDKVFALIRDIGDRVRRMNELLKARKHAEEADKMKSAFLANMSHEIRTPLNAIIGFSEYMVNEQDPEARAQYNDIIIKNNQFLLQLINDVLDLSLIESGKYKLNFSRTGVAAMLHEIESNFSSLVDSLKVKLNVEMPDSEITVLTDPMRLKQILINLVSNALKNTPQGSVTVRVTEDGNSLRFSVIDTGVGIAADKLDLIFKRFEKIDEYKQGTGLGLAISKTLIGLLGGEISVSSELGKGSTFSITIPYHNAFKVLEPQDEKIGRAKELHGRKRHILIAESVDDDFRQLQEILGGEYELSWARNGEQAVSSFILDKPDLILMNIQMPDENGIRATERIRAISTTIPIIGVTTNDFYIEQKWAMESGCNDVISKPYA